MPYVTLPAVTRDETLRRAQEHWRAILAARPDLEPALDLQRRLITIVIELMRTIDSGGLPRLSLPPKYLAAKLARGVPTFFGEPIPIPVPVLTPPLLQVCRELAAGGAGEAAEHIRSSIENGSIEAGVLLTSSLSRDQTAIRSGAVSRGLAPDLVWLVAELTVSPFAHALQRSLFTRAARDREAGATQSDPLRAALHAWTHGYCPACGSWPAMAELVGGHRVLRCSFCASAWEVATGACVYCREQGEAFLAAAPDEEREDRRIEVCSSCAGYLKTVDIASLSPFPLVAIGDMETMDLDAAAMERGYARPTLKEFPKRA